MKKIQIPSRNLFCLVSDEDYEELNQYTWSLLKNHSHKIGYAVRSGGKKHERNIKYLMHRSIMEKILKRNLTKFEHVHHINHNSLDNRRENLCLLSSAENNYLRSGPTSKNRLGELNIIRVSPRVNKRRPFFVSVQIHGIRKKKYCASLSEAKQVRNLFRKEIVNELNLPTE